MKLRIKTWEEMIEDGAIEKLELGSKYLTIDNRFLVYTESMEDKISKCEDRVIIVNDVVKQDIIKYKIPDTSWEIDSWMIAEKFEPTYEEVFGDNTSVPSNPDFPLCSETENVESKKEVESKFKRVKGINDTMFHTIQRKRVTHYIKWTLNKATDDLSIRYFYKFDDRPEYEGKFFLKSHKEKVYQEVEASFARTMIKAYCGKMYEEVLGNYDKTRNKYRKIIVNDDVLLKNYE